MEIRVGFWFVLLIDLFDFGLLLIELYLIKGRRRIEIFLILRIRCRLKMLPIEKLPALLIFSKSKHVTLKLFAEEVLFFLGVVPSTAPFCFLLCVSVHISLRFLIIFPILLTLLCPSFVKVTLLAVFILLLPRALFCMLLPKVFGVFLVEACVMAVEFILCFEVAVEVTIMLT